MTYFDRRKHRLTQMNVTDKYKFIGCEIIYREACYLAATCPRQVDVEVLR